MEALSEGMGLVVVSDEPLLTPVLFVAPVGIKPVVPPHS